MAAIGPGQRPRATFRAPQALAREYGADFIVTGDKDLLEWAEQRPPVLTQAALAELLGE